MRNALEDSARRITLALILVFSFTGGFAHAADPNGYTAQYECRAGNPNCDVDVVALGSRACDQVISPSTPWEAINWSNNTICLEAGDHTAKGTLAIPPSANGSPASYKVLRYYRAADNDDDPWRQVTTNQTKLARLVIEGDYWLIQRLTFPNVSGVAERVFFSATALPNFTNDVRDIIVNRTLIEGGGTGTSFYGISTDGTTSGDYQGLTIQNSVLRNVGPIGPPLEAVGISLHVGDPMRDSRYYIVNNEIYDWVSHPIQIGRNELPTIPGIVVENNDLYVTPALYTQGGSMAKTENPLSIKVRGVSGNPVKILHNRIWGSRFADQSFCCNGEGGDAITHYDANDYVLIKDNILFDSQGGIQNVADFNSFIGNIFYDIRQLDANTSGIGINAWLSHDWARNFEIYLNTFIGIQRHLFGGLDYNNLDLRCNVAISSAPRWPSSVPPDAQADDNVFYDSTAFTFNGSNTNIDRGISTRGNSAAYSVGQILRTNSYQACSTATDSACFLYEVTAAGTTAGSAPPYCTTLGCTTTDGSVVVKAIRAPYEFKRKLRTVTEGENFVIPYVRVHIDADEASFCPPSFANRAGIGINNDGAWNGIFTADLRGAIRNGTAGALQSEGNGTPPPPRSPFPGPGPASISGTIQAENFDNGAEGVAYHDLDAVNWGDDQAYRTSGVDIETSASADNGRLVCCTGAGEWLEHSVNVAAAGAYTLEVRVASDGVGGSFHIEFDGENKTGPIAIPNTGGWFGWQMLTSTVNLSVGAQTMRIAMDSNGPTNAVGNFDSVRFTALSGSAPYPGPNPWPVPGTIEVENFDSGGEGVAYHDVDAVNNGGAGYRPDTGVDIQAESATTSNGHLIAWTAVGEWLNYTVDVASAGTYTLEVRVAFAEQGGTFHIEFDGMDKTGPITTPNTGGWWTWQLLTRSVNLSAGRQVMRIVMDALSPTIGAVSNLDYVRLTAGGASEPTGTILRETWTGISGNTVPDLTNHPSYPANPTGNDQLTLLEAPTDWAEDYGTRIRGYVHPPVTGTYTFWIASDDSSELWLSTDASPGNKVLIASVNGWTDPREWTKFPSQQSIAINLTAGQKYYIEVLQKEGDGGDNLAVGWQLPGGTLELPIPGVRLSPP